MHPFDKSREELAGIFVDAKDFDSPATYVIDAHAAIGPGIELEDNARYRGCNLLHLLLAGTGVSLGR